MRRGLLFMSAVPAAVLLLAMAQAVPSQAATTHRQAGTEVQVSSDPFHNTGAEHATEVEPDTIAAGNDVMSVFQTGRMFGGCSDDIGWAFSSDAGSTWTHGFLPGTTPSSTPPGPFSAVSDPTVAWNGKFKEWVASALDCASPFGVSVSLSTNGTTWTNPVVVARGSSFDKEWVTCDSTSTSPHFGNCYVEWDLPGNGLLVDMSTSTDGGHTWSAVAHPSGGGSGIGGEPIVLPNGNVVVPIFGGSGGSSVTDFLSTNGGASWSGEHSIASLDQHGFAGGLRGPMFPGVGEDGAGRIYLTWPDCRFRSGCSSNDMVLTTSTNGTTWTPVVRIPIDAVTSGVDHLGGGIAVDPSTSGSSAHLGVYYYYYPNASCTASTCQLDIGYVSSINGGSTWSAPVMLAGPTKLSQIAATSGGRMVGDYVGAGAVNGGNAFAAMAVGKASTNGQRYNEAMNDVSGGQPIVGGKRPASAAGAHTFSAHVPHIVR
ncbi:MAG TPA: sialidase family protein [Streptosporangiaceae bacterium]|nr:sialidase family protein [Streptosporangiaceae bacterium]